MDKLNVGYRAVCAVFFIASVAFMMWAWLTNESLLLFVTFGLSALTFALNFFTAKSWARQPEDD